MAGDDRASERAGSAASLRAWAPAVSRPAAQLVGRRSQLQWLTDRLDEALGGQPRVAVLRGEAGIGKSRLCHALGEQAAGRGVPVYYGRCHERLSLPFLPLEESFFPVLRSFLSGDRTPGSGSASVREALAPVLGGASAPSPAREAERVAGPEQARVERARLLFQLTSLTIRLAESEPMVLIVDDLHWADESSLDFLMHLGSCLADARLLGRIPLLLVLATRPESDERRAGGLARLEREEICSTIELGGLDRFEAAELLRQLGFVDVTSEVAESLSRGTAGNPLFLETAARGRLARRDAAGRTGSDAGPQPTSRLALPDEISGAIAERLGQLSPACHEILTVASFFGTDCSIESLCRAAGISEQELAEAAEEARRHGLVEVAGERLDFAHPTYRVQLYEATTPLRRRQVHARMAQTLIAHYGDKLDGHVHELADHLIAAGPAADPAEVYTHAGAAGRRAAAVFAWNRAARCYRSALEAADRCRPAPGAADLARLLHAAGAACEHAFETDAALEYLEEAGRRFEQLGDLPALVRVHATRVRCLVGQSYRGGPSAPDRDASEATAEFERLLDRLGPEEQEFRGEALANLALLYYARGRFEEARAVAARAAAMDHRGPDGPGRVRGAIALALLEMLELDLRSSLDLLDLARASARAVGDPLLVYEASNRRPLVLFYLGHLREAEEAASESLELGRAVNDPVHNVLPLAARAAAGVVQGRFGDVDRCAYDALLIERLSGYGWASAMLQGALATAHLHRGGRADAERALEAWRADAAESVRPFVTATSWLFQQVVRAHDGELAQVRRELRSHPRRLVPAPGMGLGSAAWCCALVELSALLDEPGLAKEPARLLAAARARGQIFSESLVFHIPRMLGVAARVRGDAEQAVSLLEEALTDTTRRGALAERALAALDLARALRDRGASGDPDQSRDLAVQAREGFMELGMRPWVARATELIAGTRLGAGGEPAREAGPAPEGTVSLMFSDMERSTELLERLGDLRAREVTHDHNRIVREQLAAHDGYEAELRGDGFLLAFPSARGALLCAVSIQRAFADYGREHPDHPIRVRMGLHTGEVLRERDGFFGLCVVLTARIASEARGGEILVSSLFRELTQSAGDVRFGRPRELRLKGFPEPQQVFPVRWA